MADEEVFDTGVPVKERKKRKPMSASKKLAFKERMRLAREAKRAKSEGKEKPVKKVKKEKVIDVRLDEQVPVPAPVEEPVKPVKPKRKVRHVPNQLDDHEAQLNSLKEEIANLKKGNTSKEDMDEIKSLKAELKEIRDIAKAYKKQQSKPKEPAPVKKEEVKEVVAPVVSQPIDIPPPKPRYSTYKKSIWTQFT